MLIDVPVTVIASKPRDRMVNLARNHKKSAVALSNATLTHGPSVPLITGQVCPAELDLTVEESSTKKRKMHMGEGRDYQVMGADSDGASGGIAFLYHTSLTLGEGHVFSSKFIWSSFQLGDEHIHLAGVHAPNDPQLRTAFWSQVSQQLPDLPSCLLGDFNNVEVHIDSSSTANRMSAEESTAFFELCNLHNLFDTKSLAVVKMGPHWTRQERRDRVFS
ncbi:hypothetical protein R1sor_023232 [Riccia sorocarpa]|uniref:Endonuclease/exonuclease/phosphatase domain-containing protein n=1 Tax=Riccia sorocarpa TaxID=122646 RepID=A0ABD3GR23_9MARC